MAKWGTLKNACGVLVLFSGVLPVLCQMPGRAIINETCLNDCSGKASLPCQITELPFPCFYPKAHYKDFPSAPKDVQVQAINDSQSRTWLINLTWHLPYDYSYRAVKGFQLSVNTIFDQRPLSGPCFVMKLGAINWTQVENVHNMTFFFSCLRYPYHNVNSSIVLTLYNIPKAIQNPTSVTTWLTLPGSPAAMGPTDLWTPVIRATPMDGKVYMNFSPPFHGARYHEVCLVKPDMFKCLKWKNVTDPSQEIIFSDVTGNTSYEVWVRPHGDKKELDSWVKSEVFYVPPEPLQSTTLRSEYEKPSQPGGTIAMIVILCIVLAIFVAVILYFWKKGLLKKLPRCSCRVPYYHSRKTNELEIRNNQVPVFPIYYPESDIYLSCVETSIDIFCKHGGLDIKSYGENGLQKTTEAHMEKWIDMQVKNSVIIIYYSHALLQDLLGQIDCNNHTYRGICLKALNKITELNNGGAKIVPFVVSFGIESTDDIDLFMKQILPNETMPSFQLTHKNGSALKSVDFDRLVHKVHKTYSTKHMVTIQRDWEVKAGKLLDCVHRLMDSTSYSQEVSTMERENDESLVEEEERTPMVNGAGSGIVSNGVRQTDSSPKYRLPSSGKKNKNLSPISITNGYVKYTPHTNSQVQVSTNATVSSGYVSSPAHTNGYAHGMNYSQPDSYRNLNYTSPLHTQDDVCLSLQTDGVPYDEMDSPEPHEFEIPNGIDLKHVFFEPEVVSGSTNVSMTNLMEGLHHVNQQSY